MHNTRMPELCEQQEPIVLFSFLLLQYQCYSLGLEMLLAPLSPSFGVLRRSVPYLEWLHQACASLMVNHPAQLFNDADGVLRGM